MGRARLEPGREVFLVDLPGVYSLNPRTEDERVTHDVLVENASLYVWLGADQNESFQPLADFILMMRGEPFVSRSLITMRNQRGYGTQKNWMALRQEPQIPDRCNPRMSTEEACDLARAFRRGRHSELQGLE